MRSVSIASGRTGIAILGALAGAGCVDGASVSPVDAAPSQDVASERDAGADVRTRDVSVRFDAGASADAVVDVPGDEPDEAPVDVMTCTPGTADCDGDRVCEVALAVSAAHCGACGNACATDARCVDGRCAALRAWPRSPLASMRAGSRRPILRWALTGGATGARVEVCASRDCARVEGSWEVTGTRFRLPDELAPGVHFWRLFAMTDARVDDAPGPVWEFDAPALNVYPAHDARAYGSLESSSMRPLADVNGDGYGDYGGGLFVPEGVSRGLLWFGHAGGATRLVTASYTSAGCVPAGDLDGEGASDCWFIASGTVAGFSFRSRVASGADLWDSIGSMPQAFDTLLVWGAFGDTGLTSAAVMPTHGAASIPIYVAGREGERLREALTAMRTRAYACGPDVGVAVTSRIVAADWNRDGYDDLRMYRDNGTHWVEAEGSAMGLVTAPRCVDSGRLPRPFGVPPPCPEGRVACADLCVDLQSDRANCGACERACAAGVACVAGRCAP